MAVQSSSSFRSALRSSRFTMRKRATSERMWMQAASATPFATLMAGSRKIRRAVSASMRRMRCCLSSRSTVDLRSRTALAGVDAMAQSSRNHGAARSSVRSEEHTSELQSQSNLVCRLLLEKKKKTKKKKIYYQKKKKKNKI